MKVLVTGANGLLGHHVVNELIALQYQVRIIVRSSHQLYFDISKVEVVEGSFDKEIDLKNAAKGCNAIVHIAAITQTNLLSYSDYHSINVLACKQLLKIADEEAINNVVFVSTANTIGYGSKTKLSDESSDMQYPYTKSWYAQSKFQAEQLFIEAACKKENTHIVIVNPCFIVGSLDTKPSSGKLILMGYKKPVLFVPKGGKNFVAARDVAQLICKTLKSGKNGERYLAAGENLSFKEFYILQRDIAGYQQWIIELPNFLLKTLGLVGNVLRGLGVKTEICSMNVHQLMVYEHYTNAKAVTEIQVTFTDIRLAIKSAIDWFKLTKKI